MSRRTVSSSATVMAGTERPLLWVPGDWNAFFGYGTNLLVNVLTLTGLLRFVLGMPTELIFERVLPALGVMLFLSTAYYSWLAYDLARRAGRNDVCALPSGPGVGHIFIVVLVIMLPVKLLTGDVIRAWEAGMAWVFLQGLVIVCGGYAGKWIRKVTPRAALLGALAGVSLTYISVRPMLEMYLTPAIGLVCFSIILLGWFGNVRFFRGLPAGLIVIVVGAAIAWGSNLVGLNYGGLSVQGLAASLTQFGFHVPIPAVGHVFAGFEFIGMLLVTAIPFGIYDVIEAIDNVESAAGAGDDFPTSRVLVADGVVSMIGCLLGNPFMLVVYIGHPGWKAMGGRIGYCVASGLMIMVLCALGVVPLILAAIPVTAVLPILLFIGMLIGSQAFRETPRTHAPAIVLGILPHLAHWGGGLVNNTLKAVGVREVTPEVAARLGEQGVLLHGLEVLGAGAVLTGIVLSAAAVFVIERNLRAAASFVALGGVFTWLGLMHSPDLGFNRSPALAATYMLVAVVLLVCGRVTKPATTPELIRAQGLGARPSARGS
jgi:adenine/guanine/hypoxanthine permease